MTKAVFSAETRILNLLNTKQVSQIGRWLTDCLQFGPVFCLCRFLLSNVKIPTKLSRFLPFDAKNPIQALLCAVHTHSAAGHLSSAYRNNHFPLGGGGERLENAADRHTPRNAEV
jgi:hypothetical protein